MAVNVEESTWFLTDGGKDNLTGWQMKKQMNASTRTCQTLNFATVYSCNFKLYLMTKSAYLASLLFNILYQNMVVSFANLIILWHLDSCNFEYNLANSINLSTLSANPSVWTSVSILALKWKTNWMSEELSC